MIGLAAALASLLVAPVDAGERDGAAAEVLGRSARGRPIVVHRAGSPAARRRILVVGCIHGTECAGIAVTRRLQAARVPARTAFWIVHNLNPDGFALGMRQNSRGVDLNRNFGSEWRPIGRRWDPQYSGPRPWSEPETRVARSLILRIRPTITIWFHQPQGLVRAWGESIPAARAYARLARAPFRAIRWPHGTAPNWQNHRFPGTSSFVVELPAGRLPARDAERYAHAILALPRRCCR
jgi:murein peptide amidase A